MHTLKNDKKEIKIKIARRLPNGRFGLPIRNKIHK